MGLFGKFSAACCSGVSCFAPDCVGTISLHDCWRIVTAKAGEVRTSSTPSWSLVRAASVYDKLEQDCDGVTAGNYPNAFANESFVFDFDETYTYLDYTAEPENFDFDFVGDPAYIVPAENSNLSLLTGPKTRLFANVQLSFCREGFGKTDDDDPCIWIAYAHEDQNATFHVRINLKTGNVTYHCPTVASIGDADGGSAYDGAASVHQVGTGYNALIASSEPAPTRSLSRRNAGASHSWFKTTDTNLIVANPADTPNSFTIVTHCIDRAPYCLAYKRSTGQVARVYWDQNLPSNGTLSDSSPMIEAVIATLTPNVTRTFWSYQHTDKADACLIQESLIHGQYWRATHYLDSRTGLHAIPSEDQTAAYAPTYLHLHDDGELVYGSSYMLRRLGPRGWRRVSSQTGTGGLGFQIIGSNCGWYHLRGYLEQLKEATLYTGWRRTGQDPVAHNDLIADYVQFNINGNDTLRDQYLATEFATIITTWMVSRNGQTIVPLRVAAPTDIGWDVESGRLPVQPGSLFDFTIGDNAGGGDPPPPRGYYTTGLYRGDRLMYNQPYNWPMLSSRSARALLSENLQGPDKAI